MNNEDMKAMIETLSAAIASKYFVRFEYKGHERRIEPHVLHWKSYPNLLLFGWTHGYSESKASPSWRHFDVHQFEAVEVLTDKFVPRDFDRDGFDDVIASV